MHGRSAHAACHHDLLEGGVAGSLADSVDGALDLRGSGRDRSKGVRSSEAQIIVTVRTQHDAIAPGHPFPNVPEHGSVLGRRRVADRVRQIDRAGPFLDCGFHYPAEKVRVCATGVLGGELHVIGVLACPANRLACHLENRRSSGAKLLADMQVRSGHENVNAASDRVAQRLARQLDVPLGTARQRRDHWASDLAGDLPYAAIVALRCSRKSGFDDVDAERIELTGHPELLLR